MKLLFKFIVNYGVRLRAVCSVYAVCGCVVVRHSNACSVRQCAAERTVLSGSAAVHGAVCGCLWQCGRQCAAVQRCSSVLQSGSVHVVK
jgi:hypothetical protein